jgi:hypothetical protein
VRVILFDLCKYSWNVVPQEFFILLTLFSNRVDRQL